MKAIITVGCSASGKSTFAESSEMADYVEINRDRLRKSYLIATTHDEYCSNRGFVNLWKVWNFKWEKHVNALVEDMLKSCQSLGKNIIISDTNLNPNKRKALEDKLISMGWEVEIKVFGLDLTLDELWKRDANRLDTVGHSVIAEQYEKFRKEFPLYEVSTDFSKPVAVIFDVDGTLAHMEGIRGAFDWSKVGQDNPDFTIISSLIAQHLLGRKILIMSGRDSVCRKATLDWLNEWINYVAKEMQVHVKYPNLITNEDLFMRPEGSMESDVKIKRDLFMEHVNGKYLVACVFDDRPKVCRGWYDLGLKVIHCGNPYIEF